MKKIIFVIVSLVLWVGFTDAIVLADQGLKVEEIEEVTTGIMCFDGQENPIKKSLPSSPQLSDIAYNGELYVAVGYSGTYISEDGEEWSLSPQTSTQVVWNGKEFVSFSSQGEVYYLKDNSEWIWKKWINKEWIREERSNLSQLTTRVIDMSDIDVMAMGTQAGDKLIERLFVENMIWTGEKYVGRSGNQGFLYVSSDGINWNKIQDIKNTEKYNKSRQFFSIATNGTVTVAGGNGGRRALSEDGFEWHDVSQPFMAITMKTPKDVEDKYYRQLKDIKDIIWDGKQFLAIATGLGYGHEESSVLFTSTDGKQWIEKKVFLGKGQVSKLLWTGEEYFILGQDYSPSKERPGAYVYTPSYLLRSKDLINWDKIIISDKYLTDAIWDGKQIIVIGSGIFRVYPFDVKIDNQPMEFISPPYQNSEGLFIPLRSIFEAFGYTIDWNDKEQSVILYKDDSIIEVKENENTVKVNSEEVMVDIPIRKINNRLMISASAIEKLLDVKIEWDENSSTVLINRN